MKTKNGLASQAGITSGQKLSIIPSQRKRMNTGIMVTCAGSIIVLSMTMNRIDLPRKRKRAKPKPTSEQLMTCPAMQSVVMTTVLASAGQKFMRSGASASG